MSIKRKLKRISSKEYAEYLAETLGMVIEDEHLRKTSMNFIKALHGKKIRNTSGV